MLARLSSRGQLVIPKAIREALHLEPGAQFRVQLREGKIVLEPIIASPVDALYGKYHDVDLLGDLEAEDRREIEDETAVRT